MSLSERSSNLHTHLYGHDCDSCTKEHEEQLGLDDEILDIIYGPNPPPECIIRLIYCDPSRYGPYSDQELNRIKYYLKHPLEIPPLSDEEFTRLLTLLSPEEKSLLGLPLNK